MSSRDSKLTVPFYLKQLTLNIVEAYSSCTMNSNLCILGKGLSTTWLAVKTVAVYMIKGKNSHNKPTLPFLCRGKT